MAVAVAQPDFQTLVLSCNKDGMDSLRKGQHKAAFEQFKYAEAILIANQAESENNSLLAVTCNNLGCYYKKVGKFHGALSYLRRALKMELDLNTDEVTLAGTHLNICAILSKLEKHDKAVQHALSALDLINGRVTRTDPEKVSQDDYSVLAIAYHNVAVERDFQGQYEKAAASFQQGYQVAKRSLGEDHPLALTLGKNCDAVLQKSQKVSKTAAPMSTLSGARSLGTMRDPIRDSDVLELPNIVRPSGAPPPVSSGTTAGATPGATSMPGQSAVRAEAAEWVEKEEQAWASFAESTLGTGAPNDGRTRKPRPPPVTTATAVVPRKTEPSEPRVSPPAIARAALQEAQVQDLAVPALQDIRSLRNDPRQDAQASRMSSTARSIEEIPEALMDIIEADDGHQTLGTQRNSSKDYRPNRVIKGATRTSRVVRRTGMFNSTKHRDQVMLEKQHVITGRQGMGYVQKIAAERIQRVWRAYYQYCQENADWMTTTWICATMIQAKWRSYRVRRQKLDRAALVIQRWMRGYLVRKALRMHRAAVTIQRRAMGMLTRQQLGRLHRAALKMQALVRGGLARKRVRERRAFLTKTAISIQCMVRVYMAKCVFYERRQARDSLRRRLAATIDIQRLWRGFKGRKRAAERRQLYMEELHRHQAATKIQAMVRRDRATKRVDQVRAERLALMNQCATLLRKMWLGTQTRRRYRELLAEFRRHERPVITIQRYARGFLVRMRMWREAIRAEEELWAAQELQRAWRGYQGRVKWEEAYEHIWRREMAAALIQRNLRGWVARAKVNRVRRKIARAEFDRARRRFRAAQRIQAVARGMISRRAVRKRRERKVKAVVSIQRLWRGHVVRRRLWEQVRQQRTTMIQALVRGFLVRRRFFHLKAKIILIQRAYRRWLRKSREDRDAALEHRRQRTACASKIQARYRKHTEDKELGRIAKDLEAGEPKPPESGPPAAAPAEAGGGDGGTAGTGGGGATGGATPSP